MRTFTRFLLGCLAAGTLPAVLAQPAAPAARGELLYATHCIACHAREIHWRAKKLAMDWPSLEAQVRRWARNGGLGWSDEEVADVARYLNSVHYHFAAPSETGSGRGDFMRGFAREERVPEPDVALPPGAMAAGDDGGPLASTRDSLIR